MVEGRFAPLQGVRTLLRSAARQGIVVIPVTYPHAGLEGVFFCVRVPLINLSVSHNFPESHYRRFWIYNTQHVIPPYNDISNPPPAIQRHNS